MAKKNDIVDFEQSPHIKPRQCTGALLDIPTGRYHAGKYDDHLLNASCSNFIGYGGKGNTYKTTLALSKKVRLMSRYKTGIPNKDGSLVIYDCEGTFDWSRVSDLMDAYPNLNFIDMLSNKELIVTNSDKHTGNQYWEIVKARAAKRASEYRRLALETPFLDFYGNPISSIPTEHHLLDSISEFTTDLVDGITKDDIDAEKGDALRENLIKTRLIRQLGNVTSEGGMSMAITAHIGKEHKLDRYSPGTEQLSTLPKDLKFKNTPEKFTFLSTHTWFIRKATALTNDTTKAAEYPMDGRNTQMGDVDLQEAILWNIRSKTGATGHIIPLIISQDYGLLPSLSEYHYLKKRKDAFGLTAPEGQLKARRLELYPDVAMSRTKVRGQTDSDPRLCRALEITSELAQMYTFWMDLSSEYFISPEEIRAKLIEKKYNMDLLLDTRGYWKYDHYNKNHIPPLSTMDILNMVLDRYVPWWYPDKDSLKIKRAPKAQ